MMWSDVLTKPKQGKGFRTDNDEEQRKKTHPKLLELAQGLEDSIATNSMLSGLDDDQLQHRRSVLDRNRTLAE